KTKTTEKTTSTTETTTDSTEVSVDTTAAISDTTAFVSTETESPVVAETPVATAASQKFGYVNSADLIEIMPETKRAEASLKAYVNTLEKDFGKLQTDYQNKISEYQSQENTMADVVKQTRIQALQDLEMKMQESQMSGRQKVADKRASLFKPILEKAEKAIKDVGKENGYDYIFDTNSGAFVYAK